MFNITNYSNHPTNDGYLIYKYKMQEQADYFGQLLDEKHIKFEKHSETDENGNTLYYYAVRKSVASVTLHLNYLAIGKFRKPFIPDKALRIVVLFISILLIAFAIAGYFISNR